MLNKIFRISVPTRCALSIGLCANLTTPNELGTRGEILSFNQDTKHVKARVLKQIVFGEKRERDRKGERERLSTL